MFGLSGTEMVIILLLALLLLGPQKLPELARGLGKGLREFRKATQDVRDTIEQELYQDERQARPPLQGKLTEVKPPLGTAPAALPSPAGLPTLVTEAPPEAQGAGGAVGPGETAKR